MLPVVAIVGRPNVGKSTLFNRILGRRKAIVDNFSGVTRDRHYAEVRRFGRPFLLIDTGGFEPASTDRLLTQMREQTQLAIEEADVILFVADGPQGLTPSDLEVANLLRRVEKPVFCAVNKIDGHHQEPSVAEFYQLGWDELYPVSAEHGRGVEDLMEVLVTELPEATGDSEPEESVRLAVIGRPNVGKSSLINKLLGQERMVANPEAGTTRDSVDTPFRYNRCGYLLIDTAGIRRKGKVSQRLEKYSVIQALKALDRAQVALLVLDAQEGVTDQDATVAGYAHEKGRAIILVVNKWDLVAKDNATLGRFVDQVRRGFKFLAYAPILFVSAETGQRVRKILEEVERVAAEYNKTVSTSPLNQVLQDAVRHHQPPVFRGRRVKLFYITQTGTQPPTFTIFANASEGLHFSYQRYLENKLREAFGFSGCPIRLIFKDRVH